MRVGTVAAGGYVAELRVVTCSLYIYKLIMIERCMQPLVMQCNFLSWESQELVLSLVTQTCAGAWLATDLRQYA